MSRLMSRWQSAFKPAQTAQVTEHVKGVFGNFLETGGLETRLFSSPGTLVQESSPGYVKFVVDIQPYHVNRLGSFHGGAIAGLVDLGGSLAVASHGLWATGVSTDINISYLRNGGKPGDVIEMICQCDKIGGKLAFTNMTFFKQGSDEPFARGSHTKFIEQARQHKLNITEQVAQMVEEAKTKAKEDAEKAQR